MCMFIRIPIAIKLTMRELPPYERNGRGTPATGIIPVSIPRLRII